MPPRFEGPPSHAEQEIASQPECWRRAIELAGRPCPGLPATDERVAVLGCGTSLHIARTYATLREAAGHGETDAWPASQFPATRRYDRVLALTRTGTTTEVLHALALVPAGVPVTAVTADQDTPVARAAGTVVALGFADERSVVQTRFPTTALMLLRAHLAGARTGSATTNPGPAAVLPGPPAPDPAGVGSAGVGSAGVGPAGVGSAGVGPAGVGPAGVGSAAVDSAGAGVAGLAELPAAAELALYAALPAAGLTARQLVFLGSGWAAGIAGEAALKVREAAQSWAESYPAMEYRHGPIAVADAGTLVWIFGRPPSGLVAEIRATAAAVEVTTADPMVDLVRVQRLAVRLATARGLDPDRPRNLTRSIILH